tara:strand:+ start:596 stop:1033 length:438 start_codon:yes stop_codon:yes gene_type:complete
MTTIYNKDPAAKNLSGTTNKASAWGHPKSGPPHKSYWFSVRRLFGADRPTTTLTQEAWPNRSNGPPNLSVPLFYIFADKCKDTSLLEVSVQLKRGFLIEHILNAGEVAEADEGICFIRTENQMHYVFTTDILSISHINNAECYHN